jgi:hypothetical protein
MTREDQGETETDNQRNDNRIKAGIVISLMAALVTMSTVRP